jgi:hypothetical protein
MDTKKKEAYNAYLKISGKAPLKKQKQKHQLNVRISTEEYEALKLIRDAAKKSMTVKVNLGEQEITLGEIMPQHISNLTLGSIARHLLSKGIKDILPNVNSEED